MTAKTYSPNKALQNYDADFYHWTTRLLGNCSDFWIQDVDALLRTRDGDMMMLELKRYDYEPKPYQGRNMALLDEILKAGIEALGGKVKINYNGRIETHEIRWHGFKLLQLSGQTFDNSTFTLDGQSISTEDLVRLLSFADSQ